jgi:hypothetical protein
MIDPNTFAEFTFSSSAVGGVRASKRLAETYVKQLAAVPETTRGCLASSGAAVVLLPARR